MVKGLGIAAARVKAALRILQLASQLKYTFWCEYQKGSGKDQVLSLWSSLAASE